MQAGRDQPRFSNIILSNSCCCCLLPDHCSRRPTTFCFDLLCDRRWKPSSSRGTSWVARGTASLISRSGTRTSSGARRRCPTLGAGWVTRPRQAVCSWCQGPRAPESTRQSLWLLRRPTVLADSRAGCFTLTGRRTEWSPRRWKSRELRCRCHTLQQHVW